MGTKKQYLKTKPACKVTFNFDKNWNKSAKKVNLVGEFNNWDKKDIAMTKLEKGGFAATVELDSGKEYQYKYLVDGKNWCNDHKADKYVPDGYQGENSVVVL